MSNNNPSIEDLLEKKEEKPQIFSKRHKVQQTMTEVNRLFEEKQTAEKAVALGYEYINLKGFPVDLEALALVPHDEAVGARVVAFHHESGEVKLGTVDPTTPEVAAVRRTLEIRKYKVRLYIISDSSFKETLNHYGNVIKVKKIDVEHIKLSGKDLEERSDRFKQLVAKSESDFLKIDATEVLAQVFSFALKMEASDIHVEPEQDSVKLRMRVDGVLQDIGHLPSTAHKKVVSRVKILAKLKLNVTATPQDGSFSISLDDQEVDFRVSVLPSIYGEGLVMRILRQTKALTLDELGLAGLARKHLNEALQKTTGMILTTGPTGSGKTTTLYAILQILNTAGVKIITVEDPVEYKIKGISQTPIDKSSGMTFATGLRAILRQDPDVVMVGEIRDHETAETAIQAALTGHVVLSTLHTNDAVSAVPRLLDLEIKPFLIVGAVDIAMAQRLVRRICQKCKQEDKLDAKLRDRVDKLLSTVPQSAGVKFAEKLTFYTSKGCEACHNLGYRGRVGIFELFTVTPEMEKLILRESPVSALRQQAINDGMLSMAQDGLIKALQGLTDVYEVFRVTD